MRVGAAGAGLAQFLSQKLCQTVGFRFFAGIEALDKIHLLQDFRFILDRLEKHGARAPLSERMRRSQHASKKVHNLNQTLRGHPANLQKPHLDMIRHNDKKMSCVFGIIFNSGQHAEFFLFAVFLCPLFRRGDVKGLFQFLFNLLNRPKRSAVLTHPFVITLIRVVVGDQHSIESLSRKQLNVSFHTDTRVDGACLRVAVHVKFHHRYSSGRSAALTSPPFWQMLPLLCP